VLQGESITIRNNTAEAYYASGGGMYAVKYGGSASVNLTRSIIEDNQGRPTYQGHGGGLYLEARFTFRQVEIRGNSISFPAGDSGTGKGGGMFVRVEGSWVSVLERVVVEGNVMEHALVGNGELRGGGIHWRGDDASKLVCSLCELRGNTLRLRLPNTDWSVAAGAGMESWGQLVLNDTSITGNVIDVTDTVYFSSEDYAAGRTASQSDSTDSCILAYMCVYYTTYICLCVLPQ
jgi:hypothetical protein